MTALEAVLGLAFVLAPAAAHAFFGRRDGPVVDRRLCRSHQRELEPMCPECDMAEHYWELIRGTPYPPRVERHRRLRL